MTGEGPLEIMSNQWEVPNTVCMLVKGMFLYGFTLRPTSSTSSSTAWVPHNGNYAQSLNARSLPDSLRGTE